MLGRQHAASHEHDAQQHVEVEATRPHEPIVPDRPSRGSIGREWLDCPEGLRHRDTRASRRVSRTRARPGLLGRALGRRRLPIGQQPGPETMRDTKPRLSSTCWRGQRAPRRAAEAPACPARDLPQSVARPRRHHRPKLNLTPNIARRGSTNAVGWPKVGLKRLSVAIASSAVSSSRFSTSRSSSMRPGCQAIGSSRLADLRASAMTGGASPRAPGRCAGLLAGARPGPLPPTVSR